MAIAFRSSATGNTGTALAPTGRVVGDVIIAAAKVRGDSGTIVSPPAGWTALTDRPIDTGVAIGRVWTWYRVVGVSEPASYTFTSSSFVGQVALAVYSGVLSSSPIDVAGATSVATSATITAPAITTSSAPTRNVVVLGQITEPADITTPAGADRRAYIAGLLLSDYGQDVAGLGTARSGTSTTSDGNSGTQIALRDGNVAPNAPTLVAPVGGVSVDTASAQRLDWDFSDDNVGDSQSAYDLRYRIVGAGSWTTVNATSPASHRDFAAGFFALGDYEWQVRTYDAAGLVGPYSGSGFFTVIAAPDGPSITSPANGSTVSAESADVVWSTPDQDAYQLRTVADAAGVADTGTVYTDTGTVEGSSTRSRSVSFAVNGRTEHVQLRVRVDGLWSPWASILVAVSFTAPPTPTLSLTTDDTAGSIAVLIGSPAPGAGEPSVIGFDLMRRESTVGGDGIRIAADVPAGVFADYRVASGTEYDYAVRAYGDNGTSSVSAWTNDAAPVDEGIYGSGGY